MTVLIFSDRGVFADTLIMENHLVVDVVDKITRLPACREGSQVLQVVMTGTGLSSELEQLKFRIRDIVDKFAEMRGKPKQYQKLIQAIFEAPSGFKPDSVSRLEVIVLDNLAGKRTHITKYENGSAFQVKYPYVVGYDNAVIYLQGMIDAFQDIYPQQGIVGMEEVLINKAVTRFFPLPNQSMLQPLGLCTKYEFTEPFSFDIGEQPNDE